jgi:hypothetical protein
MLATVSHFAARYTLNAAEGKFVRSMIPTDILGYSRLSIDATAGIVTVVEAMHRTIAGNSLALMVGAASA